MHATATINNTIYNDFLLTARSNEFMAKPTLLAALGTWIIVRMIRTAEENAECPKTRATGQALYFVQVSEVGSTFAWIVGRLANRQNRFYN